MTPRDHIVVVYRAPDGTETYLGRLDVEFSERSPQCGVKRIENATRYTKIGAKRVALGFAFSGGYAKKVP